MKRTIITIAASLLALMPYGSFAQESNAGSRSDDFHGHWFIQAQGGIGATVGETKFGDLISPMATVSFGYQFTPVWSLRAGIGGWQGKGGRGSAAGRARAPLSARLRSISTTSFRGT